MPEKINFPWIIYTGCLFSDNVEISKAINSVNPQEVHVDTKALDGLFKAVASMASLFLTHLVASKVNDQMISNDDEYYTDDDEDEE